MPLTHLFQLFSELFWFGNTVCYGGSSTIQQESAAGNTLNAPHASTLYTGSTIPTFNSGTSISKGKFQLLFAGWETERSQMKSQKSCHRTPLIKPIKDHAHFSLAELHFLLWVAEIAAKQPNSHRMGWLQLHSHTDPRSAQVALSINEVQMWPLHNSALQSMLEISVK